MFICDNFKIFQSYIGSIFSEKRRKAVANFVFFQSYIGSIFSFLHRLKVDSTYHLSILYWFYFLRNCNAYSKRRIDFQSYIGSIFSVYYISETLADCITFNPILVLFSQDELENCKEKWKNLSILYWFYFLLITK